MDSIDFNERRCDLVEDFIEAIKSAVSERPGISIDGPLSEATGQFSLNDLVCTYTDTFTDTFIECSNTNVLDIWFGTRGTRKEERGELQLAADVENSLWVRQEPPLRFNNEQLAKFCVGRLREIAGHH